MAVNRDVANQHAKQVEESLEQSKQQFQSTPSPQSKNDVSSMVNIPKKEAAEKKKNFTFSLYPSVRKKIEEKAKENNYSSSSELLNTLFKEEL